jgi:hypothetical protein
MEANRNYEKALKILDYDPKTKTIKYDKPTDVENNYTPSRIHVFFDSAMTDKHGDYSTTAGRYREKLLTSINDLNKKENLSESDKHYLNKYKAELNELNKMKLSDDKPTIHLKRNTLNQRNLTGLVKALHEVGHNHVWDSREWDNSKSDRAKAEKYIDKNVKPYSDETDVNYNHKTRADEYLSDLYATRKTSPHAIKQMRSKDVKVYYDIFKKKINEESKNVNRLMKAINGTKDDTLKKQYTEEMNKSLDKINCYKKQIKSGEFEMDKLSNFASTNVHESCLIIDNDEFFMEASKNPDIKARKRTVNNLRKLGVDRAHEVDDKKLEKGVDVNLTDSYGNKHKTKLISQPMTTGYIDVIDRINIAPKKMISNKFDATFNHEAGHAEQQKRIGFDNIKERDYTVSDTDDYPIKCAKLFLQKNKDKMNDHDDKWTELHADYLSCRKVGFGKMIKNIYSFKKSKKEIDDGIENCIKYSEAERKEITDKFFKYTDSDGNEHTRTQKDVDECIKACEQAKEKLEHYNDILNSRLHAVFEKLWKEGLSEDYKNKLEKLRDKIYTKQDEIYTKIDNLSDSFTHNGISMKVVKKFNDDIELSIKNCNYHLKMLKAAFTTYDYRIKFIEDMKHIHDGHPGRCSMQYPPMTPADKKYMQEFTVEEMYLSNIITESEYLQLQERIQILTERSE